MKIIINAIPPSLNKFAGRKNDREYQALKQQWKQMVYLACLKEKREKLKKSIITITYFFKTRSRHDPDNYAGKMILDGITAAGVIEDDSFDCIELRLRGDYDKANPRTEIEIADCGARIVEILGGENGTRIV